MPKPKTHRIYKLNLKASNPLKANKFNFFALKHQATKKGVVYFDFSDDNIIEFPFNKDQVIYCSRGTNRCKLKYYVVFYVICKYPYFIKYIIDRPIKGQVTVSGLLKEHKKHNRFEVFKNDFNDNWVDKIYSHPQIDYLFNVLIEWASSFENYKVFYNHTKNSNVWSQIFIHQGLKSAKPKPLL